MNSILPSIFTTTILLCSTLTSAQLQQPSPEKLAIQTVNELAAHQFSAVEARFDERMQAALPADKLSAVWDALIEKAGPFERVIGTQADQQAGMTLVRVSCKFKNDIYDLQFAMNSQNRIAGMHVLPGSTSPEAQTWSAPEYAKPSSFHEVPVTVQTGTWKLPGSLTVPNGKGPFPAVVLVQGSGPHDQDETLGANKPLKDMAWGLASQNIAVLRYVKRTKQYGAQSAQPGGGFTVNDETTDDAKSAVALLASRQDIDPKEIYALGHSLGGMMAPRIATGDTHVAGIIVAAGTARPLEIVIIDQLKYLASLPGGNTAELQQQIAAAEKAKAEIESPALKSDTSVSLLGTHIPGSYFLDLRNYHPAEVAAQLRIPILVLQGGRDYQVTKQDYELWKSALANDPRASFKFYPGLTHLFMTGTGAGAGSPADYSVAGHVSADVIHDIAQWVTKNDSGK